MKTHDASTLSETTAILNDAPFAYIKRVTVNGAVGYAIHGMDGEVLGVAPSREVAFAAARQHELEPVSVH